ncbi:Topoisomerase 1-associated factor 1 [Geranomyces variabilis]|uniref:Topoisomerase 1-associated factor 1 n=1 Tax=Geranomyces variabilis TaxID=109894 RepID=A0AAD5TQH9_9FUNG|nr:Topoisomerase 1-associated factor 1 [Geranomyces variabilis]
MDFDDVPPPADSHLLSICAALGGLEQVDTYVEGVGIVSQKQYVLGDETLACLRDLKRLLRTDERSKDRTVVRALGRWKILQTDLLPILRVAHASNKVKIAQAVLQLFVPLTWPINTASHDAAGQQEIQRGYKEAFLQDGILSSVLDLILTPLSVPHRDRTERDHGIIGLVLTLFRNLLAIKDTQTNVLSTGERYIRSTLQESLIVCLNKAEIIPLLLSFAGSLDQREYSDWNMTTMEVFYYMFLERDSGELLAANVCKGPYQHAAMSSSSSDLKTMLEAEAAAKRKSARIPASRHGRFGGTLSFQLPTGANFTVHNPAQALNSIEDTLDTGKANNRGQRPGLKPDEYQRTRAVRSRDAAEIYLKTAHAFVDGCFNVLVDSVRKDFAAERDKVQLEHYSRFMWLCAFALKFQRMLRQEARAAEDAEAADGTTADQSPTAVTRALRASKTTKETTTPLVEPLDFDTVTEFLSLRGLAFVTGRLALAEGEKRHAEVSVAVDLLKQFLLSLDAMALHADEEYREAAQHIQNNMYYEHSTIDIAVRLVRDFKRQGHLSHLKAVVETVHVLLKMLEAYSKTKSVMFRKKKKKRGATKKPKKSGPTDGEREDEEEEEETDEDEDADEQHHETLAVKETELSFGRIVNRFATDSILATYCLLLSHYRDLDAKCIYHVTVMFHRIFVTCVNGAPLFYRLSILRLFNRILTDKRMLPSTPAHRELYAFISFCLSRFFKRAREYPMLFVEILFPKNRADCERIDASNALPPDSTSLKTAVGAANADRPEPEIEIKPGLTWRQELGVAVALLLDRGDEDRIYFATEVLMDVATARAPPPPKELINGEAQEEDEIVHEPVEVVGVTSEDMLALRRNAALRLLMRLLSFEEVEEPEPDGATFIIPANLTSTHLLASRAEIQTAIDTYRTALNPIPTKQHIRKKRKRRATTNPRAPNPAKPTPEYKSAAYISDSATDDEADAMFFAQEAEKRKAIARVNGEMAKTPVLDEWKRREMAKAEMRAARASNRQATGVVALGSAGADEERASDGSVKSDGWSSSDEEEARASARARRRKPWVRDAVALEQGARKDGADNAATISAATPGVAPAAVTETSPDAVAATPATERARRSLARRPTFVFSSDDDSDDNEDESPSSSPPDPAVISLMLAAGAPGTNPDNAPELSLGDSQPRLLDEDDDEEGVDVPSAINDDAPSAPATPVQPRRPASTPGSSRPPTFLRRRRRALIDSESDDDDGGLGNVNILETPPPRTPTALNTLGGDENADPRDGVGAVSKRRRVGLQLNSDDE